MFKEAASTLRAAEQEAHFGGGRSSKPFHGVKIHASDDTQDDRLAGSVKPTPRLAPIDSIRQRPQQSC